MIKPEKLKEISENGIYIHLAFERYCEILQQQVVSPSHGDLIIAAYSQGMLDILSENQLIRERLLEHFEMRLKKNGEIDPYFENNLIFRAIHCWMMFHDYEDASDYPYSSIYEDPEHFKKIIPLIMGMDLVGDGHRFWLDIDWRKVQSNVDRRYMIINLLQLIPGLDQLLQESVTICDVGCSQNQGLKHLSLKLPFDHLEVDVDSSVFDLDKSVVAEKINLTINSHVEIDYGIGTDLFWAYDEENRQWTLANSLLPSELRQPGKREYYEGLQASKPDNIGFKQADFSKTNEILLLEQLGPFKVVCFFTVLYQVAEADRQAMIENAKRIGAKYIVIVDAAEKLSHPKSDLINDQLQFRTGQFGEVFGYRTFLYDTEAPENGFVELWRMKSGRCESIQLLEHHTLALDGLKKLLMSAE